MIFLDPSGKTPLAGIALFGVGGATVTEGSWLAAAGPDGIIAAGTVAWAMPPGQISALMNDWDDDALHGNGLFATLPRDAPDPDRAKTPGKPGLQRTLVH